jgi:hypothetical protein
MVKINGSTDLKENRRWDYRMPRGDLGAFVEGHMAAWERL